MEGKKGKKGKIAKKMWKKSGTPGIVSKIGKKGEVEKKYSQKIKIKFEVLGNMSKKVCYKP